MISSPRISGAALKSVARLARSKIGALAVQRVLRAELRIDSLDEVPDALRGPIPLDVRAVQGRPPRHGVRAQAPASPAVWSPTSARLTEAYARGEVTPREIVLRALADARSLATRTPSVGPIFEYADETALAEAEASTERYRKKAPLGPLDGVPYAVKEQMAVRGMPLTYGTAFLDKTPQPSDAACIARLRAAGAIAIGLTPMTEYGMTPNGANPKRVMPRNPHATDCVAGGSSTGSGVAVATGLVPFAMGVDGGGSIRIPSALNGVFGIKPTWGRVSRVGDTSGGSVAHIGPLASSTLDLARVLEVASGKDPADPETFAAPDRASFVGALGRGVKGLRIAVCESEWTEATDDVAKAGKEALAALEREGAVLVPVDLALARYAPAVGYVTISVESRAGLRSEWREHASEMSDDLQLTFAVTDAFSAVEYLDAQRVRAGLRAELARMFLGVDLLALPSTVATAARVTEKEMASGFLDAKVIDGLCRFSFLGNLTGLPALSAPVGSDGAGRPIGLQLVGDAWDEATVLAAAAHLERIGAARVDRPGVSVDPFSRASNAR